MRLHSTRAGIALMSALSLLAMLGLLLAGAIASAAIAQHSAHLSMSDGPLLAAADYATGDVLLRPQDFGLPDLSLGRAQTFAVAVPWTPQVRASVTATRLPSGIYWLVGRAAMDDADSARRTVNVIARTAWLGPPPGAAFVARGPTDLAADAVVLPDASGEADCTVSVVPPAIVTTDSLALFEAPGQWTAMASAPGVRVVHGDTTISSGTFEGILMVEGDLTVDGSFDAEGLVVARGRIRSLVGLHLTGALVAQAPGPVASIDLRGATVRYAPCLVSRLLRRASPVRVVHGRAWSELF